MPDSRLRTLDGPSNGDSGVPEAAAGRGKSMPAACPQCGGRFDTNPPAISARRICPALQSCHRPLDERLVDREPIDPDHVTPRWDALKTRIITLAALHHVRDHNTCIAALRRTHSRRMPRNPLPLFPLQPNPQPYLPQHRRHNSMSGSCRYRGLRPKCPKLRAARCCHDTSILFPIHCKCWFPAVRHVRVSMHVVVWM
jgi:hypothetical protein